MEYNRAILKKVVIPITKTEIILRSIFGASGQNLRPLAHAIDIAGELMFMQQVLMDDILVTKDIYIDAAKRYDSRRCCSDTDSEPIRHRTRAAAFFISRRCRSETQRQNVFLII